MKLEHTVLASVGHDEGCPILNTFDPNNSLQPWSFVLGSPTSNGTKRARC